MLCPQPKLSVNMLSCGLKVVGSTVAKNTLTTYDPRYPATNYRSHDQMRTAGSRATW
jgi:hypothetical protein